MVRALAAAALVAATCARGEPAPERADSVPCVPGDRMPVARPDTARRYTMPVVPPDSTTRYPMRRVLTPICPDSAPGR